MDQLLNEKKKKKKGPFKITVKAILCISGTKQETAVPK